MSTCTMSSAGVSEVRSRARRRALHGLVVGAALTAASCGGSISDSGVLPSAPAAADGTPSTSAETARANVAAVRAALLESGGPEMAEILDDEALNCVAESIVADPDLTAQVLADEADDDGAVGAIVSITTTCAPEQMASAYVEEFEGMTDDEALCVVEALADRPELAVSPSGSVEVMLGCAPSFMAAEFASATGLGQADAECILGTLVDNGGVAAFGEVMEAGLDENVPLEFLDALARCGISLETLVELGRAASSSDDQAELDEIVDAYRSDCADGDMFSCDLLYLYSPFGSVDQEFGATCGGRTDGSSPNSCEQYEFRVGCADGDMNACSELFVNSPPESDVERLALDGLRAGCADGDMFGCDLLYVYSPPGSEDGEFGATCGGRTDGLSVGVCEESG